MSSLSLAAVARVVAAALVLTSAATAAEVATLPVTVTVSADHAYLRCGPGDDFYPTERLSAGIDVEVWAIEPSGYCAVRPVRGSYSWVLARDVQAESVPSDGSAAGPGRTTGVVVTDNAVARVGSQLNDLRHVTQLALEAGERITILEHVRIPDGRHAGDWVRIEPPSGEFRWARAEDLGVASSTKWTPSSSRSATSPPPPLFRRRTRSWPRPCGGSTGCSRRSSCGGSLRSGSGSAARRRSCSRRSFPMFSSA